MNKNRLTWLMCGILAMSIEAKSEWICTNTYTVEITGITTSSMLQVTTSGQLEITTGSEIKIK